MRLLTVIHSSRVPVIIIIMEGEDTVWYAKNAVVDAPWGSWSVQSNIRVLSELSTWELRLCRKNAVLPIHSQTPACDTTFNIWFQRWNAATRVLVVAAVREQPSTRTAPHNSFLSTLATLSSQKNCTNCHMSCRLIIGPTKTPRTTRGEKRKHIGQNTSCREIPLSFIFKFLHLPTTIIGRLLHTHCIVEYSYILYCFGLNCCAISYGVVCCTQPTNAYMLITRETLWSSFCSRNSQHNFSHLKA